MQHCYVNLDTRPFRYFAWGETGSTVVLLHATGFHGYVWKPIAEALSVDHQVVAPDQRGHGDSPKPEGGYAWEVFAEDLHQFLNALGFNSVIAVGHSAGATAIALCAAAHPGSIGRAVFIDPILFPRSGDGTRTQNLMAQGARKRRMIWDSRTSMFNSFHTRPPFKTWREEVLWAYIEEGTRLLPDGHVELKCPGVIEAQIYEMAPQLDGFGVLARVNIPVLVLRGASSEAFPEASARLTVSLLPEAELLTVADTTHFVPMERPDAVARAVRKFLVR